MKDNFLNLFFHSEGYVNATPNAVSLGSPVLTYSYNYVYNYTDHLGNIRLSYTKDPVSNQLKIMEENHYYPFGLKHSTYSTGPKQKYELVENMENTARPTYVLRTDYQYKYNGKEFQDELGLNMYDYGARNYDPALGRWMNIDPLAEQMRKWSPYTYVYNNPLRFIDPDGMKGDDIIYLNASGNEIHRVASNTVHEVHKITVGGNLGFALGAVVSTSQTVEQAQEMNSNLEGVLASPTTMSMEFSGDAVKASGKDSEGRQKYMADGTLTLTVGFSDGTTSDIMQVGANSGPHGFGPIPNGSYDGTGIVNTNESGMVKDGVGFKVLMTDNNDLNRTQLRVHPDQTPATETAGCIGLTCGGGDLRSFRGQVQTHFRNNSGSNIPINVNINNNPNYKRPNGGTQNSGE